MVSDRRIGRLDTPRRGDERESYSPRRAIPFRKWVHCAPMPIIVANVPRVIQIRDVPDDVHDALADAAQAEGLSLTRYMLREMEHLATRSQAVHANAAVIRQTQARVRGHVDRDTILTALREGRGD